MTSAGETRAGARDPGAPATAELLRAIAAAARFMMYAGPAMRFASDMLSSARGISAGQAAGHAAASLGWVLFGALFNSVPIWLAFAFIWFFAAWFAKVAAKRSAQQR